MEDKKGKWSAGKKPGKAGTVGKMFPLEKKGAKGRLTGSGKKGK